MKMMKGPGWRNLSLTQCVLLLGHHWTLQEAILFPRVGRGSLYLTDDVRAETT